MKKVALVLVSFFMMFGIATAAQVTLQWDANVPTPTGYRVFMRTGAEYDFSNPAWQGTETTCTVTVPDGLEAAFVARAYLPGNISGKEIESGNSNEVVFTPSAPEPPKTLIIKALENIQSNIKGIVDALRQM